MPRRAGQLPDPEPATSARSAARSRALTVPAVSDLPPAEAALLWAAAGFPVFPCVATNHDKGRDKWAKRPHPMLSEMGASRGEGGWKLATTAVTQIAEWWRTDPEAMIGIPPGLVGAVVLDCDGEPGVDAVTRIAGVEGYDLEQTFLVATPGHGLHVWFDRRSGGVEHRISNGHLLDIPGEARGDRGYVIVPPSHLPDGKQYTITGPSMSLDELPQWAAFLLPWEPRNAPDRAIGEITTAEEQAWLRKYSKEPNREGRDELARSLSAIQVATTGDAHLGRHPTATREVARLLSLTRRGSIKLDLIDAIEELRSALVGVKPKGGPDFDRFVADAIALRVKEDSALTIDLSLVPEIDQAEWDRREAERVTRITERGTGADLVEPDGEELVGLLDLNALLSGEVDDVGEWLIEPIIPRARSIAIYAKAGWGKSELSLFLALKAATGQAVLDRPAGPKLRVLYLDYEQAKGDIQDRIEEMGFKDSDDFSHLYYVLMPNLPLLDTELGGKTLIHWVEKYDAELVVIDTAARVIGGDENDAHTWQAFARHTGVPLKARGVTVLRVDHAGKDIGKGQRGSSSKNEDVDLLWQLNKRDDGAKLVAEKRRTSWIPQAVELVRYEDPLRYEFTTETWPAGTKEAADLLDTLNVPHDATRRTAQQMLKAAGEGMRTQLLGKAMKWRRAERMRFSPPPLRAVDYDPDDGNQAGTT